MGMDIYGIKPLKLIADRVEPVEPEDQASEEEWDVFIKARDNYETDVYPGRYFRANLWTWRPIHLLCVMVNQGLTVKLNVTENWGSNSGAGLKTQHECNRLAKGLDIVINQFAQNGTGKVSLDVSGISGEDGMYVKYKGTDGTPLATESVEFLTKDDKIKYKDGIKFIQQQGICVKTPYVIEDSKDEYVLIEPAHSVYLSHIREFVRFLRNCGGFEIW